MAEDYDQVLQGIFAISKPPTISTPQVLLDLQVIFSKSKTFAPLLEDTRRKRAEQNAHQPAGQKQKDEEADGRFFKMGHGGTLDPLAAGVLIIGIGRGTKMLSRFLSGTKTYETVVLFGISTDTYDVDGVVTGEAPSEHVTTELIQRQLQQFIGTFRQMPPVYSALKINGIKACDYIREGKDLPRELEAREVHVDECRLVEWMEAGTHDFRSQATDAATTLAPAARIQLTVSSGFYVRSFCHDLGVACNSLATMAALVRTRQSAYTISDPPEMPELSTAVTYDDLAAGEEVWGPKVVGELMMWMERNPVYAQNGHEHGKRSQNSMDGKDEQNAKEGVRHRFRGEWLATTKKERIKQQGGKHKGKYNQPRSSRVKEAAPTSTPPTGEDK